MLIQKTAPIRKDLGWEYCQVRHGLGCRRSRPLWSLGGLGGLGGPVSLSGALTGIDRRNASLVARAIAHATQREGDFIILSDDRPDHEPRQMA